MRHLHTRTTRKRVVGALAATLLCTAGFTAPAMAAPPESPPASAASPAPADGLALTPPMGFNNWNSTHCRAEFNEAMVKGIADIFVAKGLKDVGYEYVNLDDCWALPQRDADGKLVPDPVRFPNGIKAVADYVHAKGLKLGIYTSAGTKTCNSAGFPGALGHEYSDAQQFADWGVDYLKYDNCNNQGVDAKLRYTTMRDALLATGRPIVYSICEWGQNKPWEWAADVGQLWRTTGDISDNWGSMLSILKKNLPLAQYAGPGHWNDPDMLEVGNGGMTDTEYRSHFSMWAITAAPLLIGSDLRSASDETFDILGNREVVAVDQDTLGRQGTVVSSGDGGWVVAKEMADGSRTVALFNETGSARRIATTAAAVGLPAADAFTLRDLWQHRTYNTAGAISATVPAHGTVLVRVSADRRWSQYPPAVELTLDNALLVEAGTPAALTTTLTDLGRTPATRVSIALTAPGGWGVRADSPATAPVVPPNRPLRTKWTLTPPPGTPPGSYDLTLKASYSSSPCDIRAAHPCRPAFLPGVRGPAAAAADAGAPGKTQHRSPAGARAESTLPLTASVVVAPPAGTSSLGDLPWLSATNGYGPVERNTSNGESAAGDGHPITLGGVVYAKGLGVHAESAVEFYTGAACETVGADVGVDDEKGANGTVALEIWADGTKVASTGVLTNAMPAEHLSADVTGARSVRLVVTDGGDGIDSDHADWAGATVSC